MNNAYHAASLLGSIAVMLAIRVWVIPRIVRRAKAVDWEGVWKVAVVILFILAILAALSTGGGGGCRSFARGPEIGDC